ncbi:FMN-binding protein [Candidatus Bipolaricaulota bacterium]|nr:FMN-binding protein [Candidatus Bipolaricaulota bacterium]
MKKIVRMVLVLTLLGLISGLALSLVSNYADPIIEENEKEATREAIYYVLKSADSYETEEVDGKVIYRALDSSGELVGYAFTASGGGYQGTIRLMVGVGPEVWKVKGIQILESSETPGLGGKIRGESFKSQFRDLVARGEIGLVKSGEPERGEIKAITGATISSKAVVKIINTELSRVRSILSTGGE